MHRCQDSSRVDCESGECDGVWVDEQALDETSP